METNKVAGPDGMPIGFYQACCQIIKHDLLQLFKDLHGHRIDLVCINYGIITLIPKSDDAKVIQKFGPICLLQVLFKIFTKPMTMRTVEVMKKIIHNFQNAFIKGKYNHYGVIMLQEILRETKVNKLHGQSLRSTLKNRMIR